MLVGLVITFVAVLLLVSGFQSPRPHGLRIGLAAPRPVAAKIRSELGSHAPGEFAVISYPDAAAVKHAVADRDAAGGMAIGPRGATIVVAGALGPPTTAAVEGAFGSAASAGRIPVQVTDVRPLPASDSFGASGFMFVLAITIASSVVAVMIFATGGALSGRSVIAAIAAFAVVAGIAGALTVGPITGAVGHFWAVAGIAALLALAVAAPMIALGRAFGLPGLGIGALMVVLTGIASSGALLGYNFEPAFHRAVSQWLPPARASRRSATRCTSAAYR